MDNTDSTTDMNAVAAGEVAGAVPALKVVEKTTTHIKCIYNDTLPVNFHFTGVEWMIEFDQQVIPANVFVELKHAKIHNLGGIYAQFKDDEQDYMPYIIQFQSFNTLDPFMVAYEVINSYILDNLDDNCDCSDCDSDAGSEPALELSGDDDEAAEAEEAAETAEAEAAEAAEDDSDTFPVSYGFPCDTGSAANVTALVARELTKTNLEHLMIGLLIGALFPIIIRFYNGGLFR
jgi:hypothetical protein